MAVGPDGCDELFVYGILRRGHVLDLEDRGCEFIGRAHMQGAVLHNLGGGVGLRLGGEKNAYGELFRITDPKMWDWLDTIENNGWAYTRSIESVFRSTMVSDGVALHLHKAWVYVHTYYGSDEDYKDIPIFEKGIFPKG